MKRKDVVWQDESLARCYLANVRSGIPLVAEQLDVLLRVVAGGGEPVARFADLGCGDGFLAAAIVDRYPTAAATLVDFSPPMLDAARSRFAGRMPTPRFVLADLGTPTWVDALADEPPFDLVVSRYAIHHLPDDRKRQLYGEIFRRLRSGGLFVNVEHVSSPSPRLVQIFDNLLIDSLYAFQAETGGDLTRAQVADQYVHRPDKAANILAPVETQCSWLRSLGYVDVDCYFKLFEFAIFGGRRP